ncbi:MAG: carboxypeptidase-like regulatory domain-containing protein [Vicinamibacterales bacterium]
MARHSLNAAAGLLFFCIALFSAAVTPYAQPRRDADEQGLRGYVLAPDGTPVSSGRVLAGRFAAGRVSTTIDRTGHFRLVPETPGLYQVAIAAPGFAPYRVNLTVPSSKTITLPVIRLSRATYFHARFVTAAGEPLNSPTLRLRSVDTHGMPILDPLEGPAADQIEADGSITIGPLPWGVTMMAVDVPPLAQTRLRDLVVTGKDPLIDAGVITIQPGGVLHADIVDEHGTPVPAHDVWIEDAAPQSPLSFRPVKTNPQGRAIFDRLGPGRYRVWTRAKERCGSLPLSLARGVLVAGSGIQHVRIVIGGRATFRFVSPLVPMNGRTIQATPETNMPAPWQRALVDLSPLVRRPPMMPLPQSSSCSGATDADGRVTLSNFPPGPASVELRLFNSTYMKRVIVPDGGREITVEIPDGLLSVRVTDQRSNEPVGRAQIVWTGNGGRVEATSTGNGDALLEAVGTNGGQLAITAPDYEPLEADFTEPPATVQEVALPRAAATRVQVKVVSALGAALANAVVELAPTDPMGASDMAVTDANGVATFLDAPTGTPSLTASAEGFIPVARRVSNDNRDMVVLTLSRGYRVIASVESGATGPRLVRVFNEAGDSMDHVLDADSARSVEGPGRLSIGPLAPGTYVIEVDDGRAPWQERVQIVDRDVAAIFR